MPDKRVFWDASMRIALVVNSGSGGLVTGLDPAQLRTRLTDAGLDVWAECDDTAPLRQRLAAAAAQPGIEALVVAGGDGTLSCAASVLAGRDLPLGVLPLGTMNLFAKDLGVPLDLDGALAALTSGRRVRVDLGEVNGHLFLINSILGPPTRLQRHREAVRGRPSLRGTLRWSLGLLRHLGRYPKLPVTVRAGDAAWPMRIRVLAVVNNDYADTPGQILRRVPVDGGHLTLYAAVRLGPYRALRLALGVVVGDWRRQPGLVRIAATELSVQARSGVLRVMNDGEVLMIPPPLNYRVRPRALVVLAPAETDSLNTRDGTPTTVQA